MAKRKKPSSVKATRVTFDGRTKDDVSFRKGDWVVTDDRGRQEVWKDEDFQAEFKPASKTNALARRDEQRGLAAPSQRVAADGLTPIHGMRPLSVPIVPNGRASIGDLAAIAAGALSPNVMLPALMMTDTVTGAITKREALNVHADMKPRITALHVNANGEVVGMDLQPEEWPPRKEVF